MSWLDCFRDPPLRERLTRLLAETKEARIEARAQAAYWINQEEFKMAEVKRLEEELESLDHAVLEVEAVRPVTLRDRVVFDPAPQTHSH